MLQGPEAGGELVLCSVWKLGEIEGAAVERAGIVEPAGLLVDLAEENEGIGVVTMSQGEHGETVAGNIRFTGVMRALHVLPLATAAPVFRIRLGYY